MYSLRSKPLEEPTNAVLTSQGPRSAQSCKFCAERTTSTAAQRPMTAQCSVLQILRRADDIDCSTATHDRAVRSPANSARHCSAQSGRHRLQHSDQWPRSAQSRVKHKSLYFEGEKSTKRETAYLKPAADSAVWCKHLDASLICIDFVNVVTILTHVTQIIEAVPWLRRLVAGLSSRRPGFDPRSVHEGFMVEKVALRQVFVRVLRFYPVNFIPLH